jgi:ribonuclease HI
MMTHTAYTDGACRVSNPGQCACAWAIMDGYGHGYGLVYRSAARYLGPGLHTNNYAEYQGLIDLLMWTEANHVTGLEINCDSQLVVKQVHGEWQVKHKELQPLRDLAYALITRGSHMLRWIPGHEQAIREEDRIGNTYVDKLCNEVLDKELGGK